ncbi:MAG: hypothetical protein ABJF10_01935 [Chthoniobacter sp.]|uniref:hypothetical protein n=1 Tax=Chthoniobacter sp. TaxID=2510640 RepID=UPI0032A413DB
MAFPSGYELLREHFGDLTGWSEATFYFCAHPTTFASEFTRILDERRPYIILRVEYRGAALFSAHSSAGLCFTIYPVRREFKRVARGGLAAGLLDAMQQFIRLVPTYPNYYNRMDATFDSAAGSCATERLYEL